MFFVGFFCRTISLIITVLRVIRKMLEFDNIIAWNNQWPRFDTYPLVVVVVVVHDCFRYSVFSLQYHHYNLKAKLKLYKLNNGILGFMF